MRRKCIIVDDEPKARKVMSYLIREHCKELELVGSCANLSDARQTLLEQSPEIVFLDLQFPNEMGFDLVKQMVNRKFALIITTAHSDYALKAFDHYAQDYLLKPIHSQRLHSAVKKAEAFLSSEKKSQEINNQPTPSVKKLKIPLSVEDGVELIDCESIIRIESDGSYCKVHLDSGKYKLVSRHLKLLAQLLENSSFYRVHHSHLINLDHLHKVQRINGGVAVMSDQSLVEISRRKFTQFLKHLEGRGEIK